MSKSNLMIMGISKAFQIFGSCKNMFLSVQISKYNAVALCKLELIELDKQFVVICSTSLNQIHICQLYRRHASRLSRTIFFKLAL